MPSRQSGSWKSVCGGSADSGRKSRYDSSTISHTPLGRVQRQPRHERCLEAFARAKDITTDEGAALRVLNVQTEKVIGTTDWRPLGATFTVSAPAKVVEIQVVRHSSLRFDSKIAGSMWIDDVSLRRLN